MVYHCCEPACHGIVFTSRLQCIVQIPMILSSMSVHVLQCVGSNEL